MHKIEKRGHLRVQLQPGHQKQGPSWENEDGWLPCHGQDNRVTPFCQFGGQKVFMSTLHAVCSTVVNNQ